MSSNQVARSIVLPAALVSTTLFPVVYLGAAQAQPITSADDGTGTVVNQSGSEFNIEGGTRSGDGSNLFHSFDRFNVEAGQTANFLSQPDIHNVLGRIIGGDASFVNGLIQLTGGTSNLYLINPSGIFFGAGARLDVPASFAASTATGIRFENGLLNALQGGALINLGGNPTGLIFAAPEAGAIVNAGHLAVTEGQNLTLVGGQVLNIGTLEAPGGTVTVTAVPGQNVVRLSQEGQVLSFDLLLSETEAATATGGLAPEMLPVLLGGAGARGEVTLQTDGGINLPGTNTPIPAKVAAGMGTAIVSGTVDVSNMAPGSLGGSVDVLGTTVGLLGATVNASGDGGGGSLRIGGDFQGKGTVPNATLTVVDANSSIFADALTQGNGGRAIVWADGTTRFAGSLSAQGGHLGGNGGFAEISGKHLLFDSQVNLQAPQGAIGTVLFDPVDIVVSNADGTDGAAGSSSGNILFADAPAAEPWNVTPAQLDAIAGNVTLQADNDITFTDAVGLSTAGASLTAQAGNDIAVNADITTNNGAVSLTANDNTNGTATGTGAITMAGGTAINTGSANINFSAAEDIALSSLSTTGSVSSTTTNGAITQSGNLTVGGTTTLSAANDITLDQVGNDFSTVAITTGNNVTLVDANAIDLGASTISGNLDVTTSGAITDSGDLSVTGTTTLAAGTGNDIVLDQAGNDFTGAVSVTSGNNVTLADANAIDLGASTISGNLAVTTGGTIIDSGDLTVLGITTLEAGAANNIILDNNNNFSTVAVTSGNAVTINDVDSLILGDLNATGALNASVDIDNNTNGAILQISGTVTGATINYTGGTDNNETLTGSNVANTWTITGVNSGTLGASSFSNFVNLVGNANTDAFTFTNAGSLTGTIDGAAGNDTLTGDNDGNAFGLVTATTGTLIGKTIGWSNIENLVGGTGTDTLTGSASDENFTLTGANAGTVAGVNFSNIETIDAAGGTDTVTGTSGDDAFSLTGTDNQVSGLGITASNVENLNASGGTDTLTGTANNENFTLTGANAGTVAGVNFSSVETIDAAGGSDTLDLSSFTTATDTTLNSDGTGTVTGIINVANLENLTTGSGDDTVAVQPLNGSANRTIDLGSSTTDTLNFDGGNAFVTAGLTNITTTGFGDVTYNNVERLNLSSTVGLAFAGTTGDDRLTLTPIDEDTIDFAFDGSISGQIDGSNTFQFDGGDGDDLLTLDGRNPSGILLSGGITYNGDGNASTNPGDGLSVIGDSNNDIAIYAPDATIVGSGIVQFNGRDITFTGLEPIDISGMVTVTLSPAGSDNNLTLTNGTDFFSGGTNDAIRVSGTTGGVAIETVALFNNTNVAIDTSGISGTDTLTIASADNNHGSTTLTLNTGTEVGDVINITGNATFAEQISLSSGGSIASTGGTLTTDALKLDSAQGVGTSGNPIFTNTATIAARATNAGSVAISEVDSIEIGTVDGFSGIIAPAVSITAGGTITDAVGTTIAVTGLTNVSGTTISLGAGTFNTGTLTFNSAGAVTIAEDSAMDIVGVNTAGSADLDSIGAISDAGTTSVTVTGLTDANGTSIDLGGGTFNTGTLTFNSTGAVTIAEDSNTNIVGVNTAGSADLDSIGAISDAGTTSVTVTGLTDANGTSIDLGGGTFNTGTLTFNSTGTVTIAEDSAMDIVGVNTAGSADLDSIGAISDAGATSVTVTGLTDANGTSIDLGGGTFNTGTLTFNSAGAVTIAEDSAMDIVGDNTGGTTRLSNALNATRLNGTLTVTSLDIINNGTLALSGTVTSANNLTIDETVTLEGSTTVNTGTSNLTFDGTIDGEQTLVLNSGGTTTLNQAIGNTASLTSLTTNAGGTTAINGGTVTTTGDQTYNDAVVLGADTTLNGNDITFANTVDGGRSLAVQSSGTGTTTFGGAVGTTTALTSLTTNGDGTTAINGGTVTTTGDQTYNDAVVLGADTTLNANDITFTNTVDGGRSLAVQTSGTGTTTFGGAVGTTTALTSLTTNGDGTTTINGGTVTTTGDQTYNDAVVLGSDTTLNGNDINFANTVDGGRSLAVQTSGTGTTTFGGAVGTATALTSLTTNADGTTEINGGTVTTTGDQTYNDAVVLGADTTLNGNDINFANTVDGLQALDIQTSGSGTTTFEGAVGSVTNLTSLNTNSDGQTNVNANITTVNTQTFNDPVVIDVNSATLSGGTIVFNDTITGTQGLTLNSPGNTDLNRPVSLGSLTTDAGGTTTLDGGTVTTTADQIYGDSLILGTTTTLEGANLTLNNTVNGAQVLTLNSDGITDLNGVVGGITPLTSLTTDIEGVTNLDANITTSGAQTFNDAVTVNTATVSLTGQALTLNNTVNGTQGLILGATDAIVLTDAVKLATLSANSDNSTVEAKADITTTGTTVLTAALNLSARNITTRSSDPTRGSDLTLTSETGAITTDNLTTTSNTGGNVTVRAGQDILTGAIDSRGLSGAAGDVLLDPNGNIEFASINAQGATTGGDVNVQADRLNQFVRATNSFTASNGVQSSISTIGLTGNGNITINHGGGALTPFVVGDTTARNGSAAGLTTGQSTIDPTRSFSGVFSFLGTYIQDNIGLIAKDINGNVVPFISSNINSANTPPIESIAGSLSGAVATADTNDLEGQFSDEFSIFGVQPDRRLLVQDVPEFLKVANEQTDRTFAAVYLYFAAPTGQSPDEVLRSTDALSINNPLDAATMVVVTAATGEIPTPVSLPVNRQIIDRWVEQLRGDVKQPDVEDLRNRYMQNARNLYNKLMRPIVEALPDGVDNLIFVLGDGLRQIPLASLYDEEKGQFLVEQYGITLVPAFSYLDDADQDLPVSLKNAPVFAMGTSTFPPESELDPLPGVPTELDLIAETRQATILKDEEFTVDNLLDRRDTSPIVHLATHANFGNTRDPDSDNPTRSASTPASFIQFSDRQLPIREVNTLDLNRPIVELFTLSACETAVGDRDAELGFAGLSIQAGAESALASLWKVGDAGTPVFMGEFYQQLNQQVNRTEALRQAQIAMIRGRVKLVDNQITLSDGTTLPITDESFQTALRSGGSSTLTGSVDLTHPFYWAAFTLIGSPW